MDQAEELIPIIVIIGGADGPTSIYVVGRDNFWVLVILLAVYLFLFIFVVIRFIKNLKSKNKVRSIIYGTVIFLFVLFTIGYTLFKIGQIRKQMNEQLELYMQSSE